MIMTAVLGFAGVTWQWREATRARDVALEEKRDKELQRQQELKRQQELQRQQEMQRQQELRRQQELQRQQEMHRQKEMHGTSNRFNGGRFSSRIFERIRERRSRSSSWSCS